MTRVTLTVGEEEKRALTILAARELRDPRMQAVLLIREGLERRGLISVERRSKSKAPAVDESKQEGEHKDPI
jgi:hypothetical protein